MIYSENSARPRRRSGYNLLREVLDEYDRSRQEQEAGYVESLWEAMRVYHERRDHYDLQYETSEPDEDGNIHVTFTWGNTTDEQETI